MHITLNFSTIFFTNLRLQWIRFAFHYLIPFGKSCVFCSQILVDGDSMSALNFLPFAPSSLDVCNCYSNLHFHFIVFSLTLCPLFWIRFKHFSSFKWINKIDFHLDMGLIHTHRFWFIKKLIPLICVACQDSPCWGAPIFIATPISGWPGNCQAFPDASVGLGPVGLQKIHFLSTHPIHTYNSLLRSLVMTDFLRGSRFFRVFFVSLGWFFLPCRCTHADKLPLLAFLKRVFTSSIFIRQFFLGQRKNCFRPRPLQSNSFCTAPST